MTSFQQNVEPEATDGDVRSALAGVFEQVRAHADDVNRHRRASQGNGKHFHQQSDELSRVITSQPTRKRTTQALRAPLAYT